MLPKKKKSQSSSGMWPLTVYPCSSRWHIGATLGGLAEFKKGRKLREKHAGG